MPMWRLRLQLVIWGLFSLAGAVALVVLVTVILHNEVVLDLHHSNAVGRVVDVHKGGRGPGSVQVEFSVEGKPALAWVELSWFGNTPKRDDQIRIEYSGSNPGTARRAGAHDIVPFGAALGGITLFAVASVRFGGSLKKQCRSDKASIEVSVVS